METVEHFARVMLTAELLGGPRLLTRADVQKLMATKYGCRNFGPARPTGVVAAENGRNLLPLTQQDEAETSSSLPIS
jgi:L-fuculose-phosphate aldolase